MSFLKVLHKFEIVILGEKAKNIKPKDHWKKYRKIKKAWDIFKIIDRSYLSHFYFSEIIDNDIIIVRSHNWSTGLKKI